MRLLVATVIAFAAWAAPASAAVSPCLPGGSPDGPLCTFWTGKVTFVADGDTIDVDIAGDGRRRSRRVRLTGFNAMELTTYSHTASQRRGDCHGVEATNRLEQLLRGGRWRVRLAAQDPRSVTGGRLRRQVSTRIGGQWVDVGRYMLAEGHALWMPNGIEWAWNRDYADLSRQAAAAGRRLWDTHGCGAGPSTDAPLTLDVNYDAKYNDRFNVNGEWAEIHNDSAGTSRSSVGGSATRHCAATPSRRAPSCRRAGASGSAWATAPTPLMSCTGASTAPRSRTRATTRGRRATAATCSTRAATCGSGSSTTRLSGR